VQKGVCDTTADPLGESTNFHSLKHTDLSHPSLNTSAPDKRHAPPNTLACVVPCVRGVLVEPWEFERCYNFVRPAICPEGFYVGLFKKEKPGGVC